MARGTQTQFGLYLQRLRLKAGDRWSQQDVADRLKERGREVSQSLVAQYEKGRIKDPSPEMLRALAEVYGVDYLELVLRFVRERFDPGDWSKLGLNWHRWGLVEAAAGRFEVTGGVKSRELEESELRAKREIVGEWEVLDVAGVLAWVRHVAQFRQIWLVVPQFLDDTDEALRHEVAEQIKRRRTYVYFVSAEDAAESGRFWLVREAVTHLLGGTAKARQLIERHMIPIPLSRDDLTFLQTDHIIVDPQRRDRSMGFQYLRKEGRPHIAVKMQPDDLRKMVDQLSLFAEARDRSGLFKKAHALSLVPEETGRRKGTKT